MSHRLLPWVCHAIRCIVGGLFIYAGSLKLADVPAFAIAVDSFRLLPWPLVAVTAVTLPVLEIAAGLLWITNLAARPAALVIFGLCAVFCAVLASAMIRGLDVSCGCFGALADDSVGAALLRAAILLGATAFWWRFAGARPTTHAPRRTSPTTWPQGTVASRVGVLLAAAALTMGTAGASVTLSVQFGELYHSDGTTRAPAGSVALLVADTAGDGIPDPVGLQLSAGQTFGGDNLVLAMTIVAAEESTGGAVRHVDFGLINFNYPGSAAGAPLSVGTKLWLIWFPSLSTPDARVPGGASYGLYRSDTMQPGSESTTAFVTPPDGGTYRLAAFTDSIYTSLQKEVPGSGNIAPADFAASSVTQSAFDSWLGQYFSEEEIADPTKGGAAADIDGDGIPNLAEYAFGLNPREYDPAASRPQAIIAEDRATMTYSYPEAKGVSDVTIVPQMSATLAGWTAVAEGQDGVSKSVAPRDENTDLVTWTIPVPAPGDKMFLRVQVNRQ